MLIETVILALFISVILGGKLSRISHLHLKAVGLVPLSFAMQGLIYFSAVHGIKLGTSWLSPAIDTGSYVLLLVFGLLNRKVTGMRLITLGIALNGLVIGLNQGSMPVDPAFLPETSRKALLAGQGTHALLNSGTRLSYLVDRFYINIPGIEKQLFSVGDVLIDLGMFILILFAVLMVKQPKGLSFRKKAVSTEEK